MEPTVYFLYFDEPFHELFIMRQTRGHDAVTIAGPFSDHAPAAALMENAAHGRAKVTDAKTCELAVIPDWAQAEHSDQFDARTCWLVQ
jgi:hypothetical protein